MSNLLRERRLRHTDGRFAAQVGDAIESAADYAEHYQALREDAVALRSVVSFRPDKPGITTLSSSELISRIIR